MKLISTIQLSRNIESYGDDEINLHELGLVRPSKYRGWKSKKKRSNLKLVVINGEKVNE